jgi:hypothetical protein
MLVQTDLRAGTRKSCGHCGALIVFNPQTNLWLNVNILGIQSGVHNHQEND